MAMVASNEVMNSDVCLAANNAEADEVSYTNDYESMAVSVIRHCYDERWQMMMECKVIAIAVVVLLFASPTSRSSPECRRSARSLQSQSPTFVDHSRYCCSRPNCRHSLGCLGTFESIACQHLT